jgi:dipeptidyl aminopeptidase/acylaminoacyl peptidase
LYAFLLYFSLDNSSKPSILLFSTDFAPMLLSRTPYLPPEVLNNYQLLATTDTIEKIVWKSARGIDSYGTLISPASPSQGLVVYCRGGYGDAVLSLSQLAHSASPVFQYAKAGYHVLALEYTGTGGSDGGESCNGADQIDDIVESTQYAVSLGFESVLLVGVSRGADAVLLAANTGRGYIHQVIAASGLYDLTMLSVTRPDLYRYLSKYISVDTGSLQTRSILHTEIHDGLRHTPIVLLHGGQDTRSPIAHAHQLHKKLVTEGCPVTLQTFTKAGHSIEVDWVGLVASR